MLAWRAARTAARSRGFAAGSGRPVRAAVVSSRMILVKTLARFLSCAPFRYMMFLNCEWPAISLRRVSCRHHPIRARRRLRPRLASQYGRIGASPAPPAARFRSAFRQVRDEAAAEAHRFDAACPSARIVGFEQDAAQRRLALGDLRALARHLGDK